MKSLLPLTILFLFGFGTINAQEFNLSKGAQYCHLGKAHSNATDSPGDMNAQFPHSFDVLHYKLDLDLSANFTSPFPQSFQANVIVQFRIDSALNSIKLNAVNSSLLIDSVRMAGVSFTHTGNMLTINLDRNYEPGEIAEVKIYYHHKNVEDNAIYCSGGFLFTDCEPEGARKWFPCYDKPSDKATAELTAKVPSNVKLGSNGKLQDSTTSGGFTTYHWKSRDPLPTYLVVMSARSNYKLDIVNWINPSTNDTTPIRFYYNQGENPVYIQSIIGNMVTFFSEQFGDHPFEKNGFATLNNEFAWGGMENQTLTSLCPGCWYEWLIAHEFAHQWFGDMITCATWADIFLNEGFATWTENHWIEHTSGYNAYKNEMDNDATYYLNNNPGWAISNPAWSETTPGSGVLFNYAITYMKGSCVMHQLRYVLGDSTFFAAIKAYATDTTDFKYKSATIPQFKDKLEDVTGMELDWFFNQWIFTANHPIYQNVYNIEDKGDSKWKLSMKVKQLYGSIYWQMPLEFKILFEAGNDTTIRVFNSINNETFSFIFDQKPTQLIFDPNNDILLKQATTVLSASEPSNSNAELKVFPLPFSDKLSIEFNSQSSKTAVLDILDPLGNVVYNKKLANLTNSVNSTEIQTDFLKSGIYFLRLRTDNSVTTETIIKE